MAPMPALTELPDDPTAPSLEARSGSGYALDGRGIGTKFVAVQ